MTSAKVDVALMMLQMMLVGIKCRCVAHDHGVESFGGMWGHVKAPTIARFPWFSRLAKLNHSGTCKEAIGVKFLAATIFGSGLRGVRLLNNCDCKSGTKDEY